MVRTAKSELLNLVLTAPGWRESKTDRVGYAAIVAGMAGLVDGTLRVGSSPSWPDPKVWAGLAVVAMVGSLAAIVNPRHDVQGVALFLTLSTAALRGFGYIVAPSERLGLNTAAVGAYAIVLGVGALLVNRWRKAPE